MKEWFIKLGTTVLVLLMINILVPKLSMATGSNPTPEELYDACTVGCDVLALLGLVDCGVACGRVFGGWSGPLLAACIVGCLFSVSMDYNECQNACLGEYIG